MSEAIKKAYVVEWSGPFNDDQLDEMGNKSDSGCLYIVSGLRKYQRGEAKIQYIGISERGAVIRFNDKGHPSEQVIRDRQYWLGHLSNVTQEMTRANLELIEHALIYTCQTDINKSKKASCPKKPVVVVNRWLTTDGTYRERRISPVQKAVPDVILFDGDSFWTCERLNYEPYL